MTRAPPTVLCVHQGSERYGSDKSFVAAVAAIRHKAGWAARILLPGRGPIDGLVADAALPPARTRHIWVLRKADLPRELTIGLPRNLWAVGRAMADLWRHDIVYVNTAVIVDFLFASILTRRRLIVHVREIPAGIAMTVIRRLLIAARARVIFNSRATATAFGLPPFIEQAVVHNGFDLPAPPARRAGGRARLRVLCIGRLNAWKGQEVLVEACALLPEDLQARLEVRIVGGVYRGQVHFRTALQDRIARHGLQGIIGMQDFADDPAPHYTWADVVVVPSTLPEPFGRVAIEGMAHGCAVLASDHGGLREIVVTGGPGPQTGELVALGDPLALATALRRYCINRDLVTTHGKAGRARFEAAFTQAAADRQLIAALGAFSGCMVDHCAKPRP